MEHEGRGGVEGIGLSGLRESWKRVGITRTSFVSQVRLGVPFALSLMAEMVMMWTDTWVVSKLGVASLASMSLAFNYAGILFVGGMGMMIVVNPLASRKMGEGDDEGGVEVVANGVWLGFLVGVFLWFLTLPGPWFLLWTGQDAELVKDAWEYLRVFAPGIPFALATIGLRGLYAASGKSGYYGVIFAVGVVANGVLDVVLVLGVGGVGGIGLVGAAWATLILNLLIFVSALTVAVYHSSFRPLGLLRFLRGGVKVSVVKVILVMGLPVGASFLLEETFFMGSTFLVGHLGREALAIHQVMIVVSFMSIGFVWGFGEAARAEMGWAYGRGDRDGFLRSMWTFLGVSLVIVGVTFVSIHVWVDEIVVQFFGVGGTEEGVTEIFRETVLMWTWFILPEVPIGLGVSVLYALGETRSKMVIDLVVYWLMVMPCIVWLIFVEGVGIYWVWFSSGIAVTMVSLLTVGRAYHLMKSGRINWERKV